ncbi:MAG: hypothetical protein RLZZ416_100 [Candidatus Parcubacteria bacterium]|jgi:coenzyme F420-0:L-glutamate ligase
MNLRPIRTRIFRESEDLTKFIARYVPRLKSGAILALTSKVAALAEGRVGNVADIEALVGKESEWTLRARNGRIAFKDGLLMWNAGADESNADGRAILLPKDSFKTAAKIRAALKKRFRLKQLGVLITDSHVGPLRSGVVGVALGYAGFKGLRDYRGSKDLFGRKLRYTQTNVADSLATAAALVMGEGSERRPLCIIEDAPVEFAEYVSRNELRIPFADDMYAPLFKKRPRG